MLACVCRNSPRTNTGVFQKECIKNKTVTKELLEDFINNKKFKLKQFIDFLDDDIHNTSDTKDYFYLLKKVIECLMNDKQFEI